MSDPKKTSTFTVHHGRCDPSKWTPNDVLTFANFLRYGSMQHAAALARLGVQLVMSEHHTPKGGMLEQIGWTHSDPDAIYPDLDEATDYGETMEVYRLYRGPAEYAVRYTIGDGDGNVDGDEYEVKATEAEAEAFLKSLCEPEVGDSSQREKARK